MWICERGDHCVDSCDGCEYHIEVEQIVRCKECIHRGLPTCMMCCIEHQELRFLTHDPDFYCAYGKKEDSSSNESI